MSQLARLPTPTYLSRILPELVDIAVFCDTDDTHSASISYFRSRRVRPPGSHPGWFDLAFARPPVQGLDFEVDVRGIAHELVI